MLYLLPQDTDCSIVEIYHLCQTRDIFTPIVQILVIPPYKGYITVFRISTWIFVYVQFDYTGLVTYESHFRHIEGSSSHECQPNLFLF